MIPKQETTPHKYIISRVLPYNCFLCHNTANLLIICQLVKFHSELRIELEHNKRYLPTRKDDFGFEVFWYAGAELYWLSLYCEKHPSVQIGFLPTLEPPLLFVNICISYACIVNKKFFAI